MPVHRPPSRADRLDLVARVLADRPGLTARELAADLGLSERTIFRDLDALRERGLPIEASRGRGGGLRVHRNWGMGRVLFSRDEALGTLLALAVAECLALPMLSAEVGRVRRRIADVFPARERRRLEPLRERIFVGPNASAAVRASWREPRADLMRTLQENFVAERGILVKYSGGGAPNERRPLQPHALLINWPAWYLLAFDVWRDAPRTFRLDRFTLVQRAAADFTPRPRAMLDAAVGPQAAAMRRL